MAQDLLDRFTPLHNQPVDHSNVATLVLRFGHRQVKFPESKSRAAYFASVMSSLFNASGLLVTLVWSMPTAAAGVKWEIVFERHDGGVFNFASSGFGTIVTATAPAPAGANLPLYTQIACANGPQTDGILGLESYRLSVRRRGDQDGVGQAAYLHSVIVQNLT